MSGQELANRVGYEHQSAIGNLENRATGRGGTRIVQIAHALNFPLQWFLDGPDVDDLAAIDPALQRPHHAAQDLAPYHASPRAQATFLLGRLTDSAIEELLPFLTYLASTPGNSVSQSSAGDPLPAPRKAA